MSESSRIVAVLLAAGRGSRLGRDKALVPLPREPVARVLTDRCRRAGCDDVVIVRQHDAAPLPDGLGARVVSVESDEMIESVRGGLRALAADPPDAVLVLPIDYAMVGLEALTALTGTLRGSSRPAIVLPICRGRPGHPVGLRFDVAAEALDQTRVITLRDVIRRDPQRVVPVSVDDGWVLRDIDSPEDLRAAIGALENALPATVLMARHRSRRAYLPDAVGDRQIEWLIDSARHASTSSYIQAYSAVVVRDPDRKHEVARLCADQRHIHEAPVFIAVCADLHKLEMACARHGRALAADSLEIFVQATVDAALFGQNLQLAAESEGLGSCMIGAARNHPTELAAVLGLPLHVYVLFGMTLGWPADDPEPRVRMPLRGVLHDECYRCEGLDDVLTEADAEVREWARRANQRAGSGRVDEQRGWTDRMAFLYGGDRPPKGREHLLDELRRLGFGLRPPEASDGDAGADTPSG